MYANKTLSATELCTCHTREHACMRACVRVSQRTCKHSLCRLPATPTSPHLSSASRKTCSSHSTASVRHLTQADSSMARWHGQRPTKASVTVALWSLVHERIPEPCPALAAVFKPFEVRKDGEMRYSFLHMRHACSRCS